MAMYTECQRQDYLDKFGNGFRRGEDKNIDLWMEDIRRSLREKGLDELEWEDRHKWREKIEV